MNTKPKETAAATSIQDGGADEGKRFSVVFSAQHHAALRKIADKEERSLRVIIERLIKNEAERQGIEL